MKTATISNIILAAASTALAGPSNFKRALQPLELLNFHADLYEQTPPTSYHVSFALNDPNNNVDTDCDAVWSEGMAGTMKFECSNAAYEVNFPNGIYNIENFDLRVSRADGSEAGQNTVSGADWQCKQTPNQYPEESCSWVGVFNIDVTKSS
jgi:hypothetical protein